MSFYAIKVGFIRKKPKKNFDISLICTTFAPSLQGVGQGVLRLSRLR